jgi:hypothetical protein
MAWSVIVLFIAAITFLSVLNAKYIIAEGGVVAIADLCVVIILSVFIWLVALCISNKKSH